jgi:hypothetical protein
MKYIKLKRGHDQGDFRAVRYRVTLFLPLGMYPRGVFCFSSAMFYADEEIVFAVTHGAPWYGMSEDLPYSEVDWMHPELVRLLGAMIMAENFLEGLRSRFYVVPHTAFILNEELVEFTPSTARAIKRALLRTVNNSKWPKHIHDNWAQCRGEKFALFDPAELDLNALPTLWEKTSTENHLLMRGVQALIKSDMLGRHYEFQEEGAIATFIALDASFQMVLRHLCATGNSNPSAKDAGLWLYETFDKHIDVHGAAEFKYFEDFYDQRVQSIHPGSRFGDMPFAPIMVDDRMHLRDALPGVFAYLTLGEHTPRFWEYVSERRRVNISETSVSG